MESLINVVNQLQEICSTVKELPKAIDLPQIVVVGTQSSGKSSVIESIVKRNFLPRGAGIVTRRPLVIQLVKLHSVNLSNGYQPNGATDDGFSDSKPPSPDSYEDTSEERNNKQYSVNGSTSNDDYVKFSHTDKKFYDFDLVRDEIENETDRVCGTNKGICSKPIILTLYSRDVVDLTLVDLPGLTKNPVGDQPDDIEIQIRELVMEYINNVNSIILAVTAANTDFATSEAVKLAREVDPDGRRTVAVLTKLDIMDPGTDALDVLGGKLILIRLGIIGVVNRSQADIIKKKSIERAIQDEAQFLMKRYPSIADKHGTPYLSKRLSQILMRHIRERLPDLKLRINSLISIYQSQMNSYGESVTDKAKTIIDLITKFSLSYCDTIKGGKRQIKTSELCGGARIQYIFHETFGQALSLINPLENLSNIEILTAARNAAGVRTSICVPDVFELLVGHQIKRLEDPSLRCVELVHDEMSRFVRHCGDEVHLDLLRFPKLREKVEEIVTKLLNERLPVTREAVQDLVGYGSAFIDTEHPRLRDMPLQDDQTMRSGGDINSAASDDSTSRSERELRECQSIAKFIAAYFNIVREEVKVFVPRAIMHCMVNHIKSNLQSALIKEIYHRDQFDYLLTESEDIAKRRRETLEILTALKKAGEVINSIHYPKP